MKWSPEAVDRLERAIVEGARVQVWRRGTEYMVVPRRIRSRGPGDELVGTTNTGDELSFPFEEIEGFEVVW
jgi:hypothetical protein